MVVHCRSAVRSTAYVYFSTSAEPRLTILARYDGGWRAPRTRALVIVVVVEHNLNTFCWYRLRCVDLARYASRVRLGLEHDWNIPVVRLKFCTTRIYNCKHQRTIHAHRRLSSQPLSHGEFVVPPTMFLSDAVTYRSLTQLRCIKVKVHMCAVFT